MGQRDKRQDQGTPPRSFVAPGSHPLPVRSTGFSLLPSSSFPVSARSQKRPHTADWQTPYATDSASADHPLSPSLPPFDVGRSMFDVRRSSPSLPPSLPPFDVGRSMFDVRRSSPLSALPAGTPTSCPLSSPLFPPAGRAFFGNGGMMEHWNTGILGKTKTRPESPSPLHPSFPHSIIPLFPLPIGA
jgi:hypothetical protein